jgi:hypothetical protein
MAERPRELTVSAEVAIEDAVLDIVKPRPRMIFWTWGQFVCGSTGVLASGTASASVRKAT